MTEAEEKRLWAQYKEQGDGAARDALIMHHMRIVKYIAGRMAIHVPSSVEMNDLVSWGVLGLLDAAERFDHRQNIKFTTYATMRIRGAIIDEIRTLDWAPRSLRSMARKVGEARNKLRQAKGTEPSVDEIGGALGTTAEHVEDTIAQIQTAHVLSLDDYLPSEEEDTRKSEVTGNAAAASPEDTAARRERHELLAEAILQLPDQQQKVLNLYYYEELTLKEIGAVLDVSESRVCQVHSAAMKRLRKVLAQRGA